MEEIQQRKAGGMFPRNKHLTWHLNYKMKAGFKKRKFKKSCNNVPEAETFSEPYKHSEERTSIFL